MITSSLYDGLCTITEYVPVLQPNKSTSFQEVVVSENIPCRLSHQTITSVNQTETGAPLVQVVKLILSPEVVIKEGSKITVTQNNVTTDYQLSGVPAVFASHQEVVLEIFRGWA